MGRFAFGIQDGVEGSLRAFRLEYVDYFFDGLKSVMKQWSSVQMTKRDRLILGSGLGVGEKARTSSVTSRTGDEAGREYGSTEGAMG